MVGDAYKPTYWIRTANVEGLSERSALVTKDRSRFVSRPGERKARILDMKLGLQFVASSSLIVVREDLLKVS